MGSPHRTDEGVVREHFNLLTVAIEADRAPADNVHVVRYLTLPTQDVVRRHREGFGARAKICRHVLWHHVASDPEERYLLDHLVPQQVQHLSALRARHRGSDRRLVEIVRLGLLRLEVIRTLRPRESCA